MIINIYLDLDFFFRELNESVDYKYPESIYDNMNIEGLEQTIGFKFIDPDNIVESLYIQCNNTLFIELVENNKDIFDQKTILFDEIKNIIMINNCGMSFYEYIGFFIIKCMKKLMTIL